MWVWVEGTPLANKEMLIGAIPTPFGPLPLPSTALNLPTQGILARKRYLMCSKSKPVQCNADSTLSPRAAFAVVLASTRASFSDNLDFGAL